MSDDRNRNDQHHRDRNRGIGSRPKQTTVVYGILCFVLTLVVVQLWLLTATMSAYLGGDGSVVWPAFSASLVCLALNLGLLRYLYLMERP